MLQDAQFLERNFTVANRYDQDSAGNAIALPVTQAPQGGGAVYTIQLASDLTTYTVQAVPVTGGSMDGDECGTLTLDQAGAKDVTGSASKETCWNK